MENIHKIFLGNDRKGLPVFYITHLSFGVCILEASTRVGKTQVARNIVCYEAGKCYRPTIVFDYSGEWKYCKFANLQKPEGGYGIPHLKTYSDIVFKLSDFNRKTDWQSLGFPPGAARKLAEMVVEYLPYHEDNFDKFYAMMEMHPESFSREWIYKRFESKFGFVPQKGINKQSLASLLDRLPQFKYIFWDADSQEEQTYVPHWGKELIENRCIHVNYEMKTEDEKMIQRARAVTGKILQQISDYAEGYNKKTYLELLHPLLVFEEADRVFPYMGPDAEIMPSSVLKINEFITKKQKYGVELLLIVQNVMMLHPSARENFHTWICGVGGTASELIKYLQWDVDLGIREFILVRKGKWQQQIFSPTIVPAMLIKEHQA